MLGKAHLLCSSLSNFSPDETKLPCLIRLQGYVVVGNQASPNPRKTQVTWQGTTFSKNHLQNGLDADSAPSEASLFCESKFIF